MQTKITLLAAMAAAAFLGSARAQEQKVVVNGFGEWRYGQSDGNVYLSSDDDGDFSRALFGLNVSARVEDRIRIVGQVLWDQLAAEDVSLEVGFAEYFFNDKLQGRVGRMRVPFGTYAENLRIGIVRPFFDLPQSVYGRIGIVGDSFDGIHLTGRVGSGWRLGYDVFGGGMDLDISQLAIANLGGSAVEPQKLERLVGAHFALSSPIEGLQFSAATNTAEVDTATGDGRHVAWLVGAEYVTEKLHLRGEFAREYQDDADGNFLGDLEGWYTEVAYMVTSKLQLGAQYDEFDEDVPSFPVPDHLIRHRGVAVGINFWIARSLVVKAENRWISGNALANPGPEALGAALFTGAPIDEDTNVLLIGAQFSF